MRSSSTWLRPSRARRLDRGLQHRLHCRWACSRQTPTSGPSRPRTQPDTSARLRIPRSAGARTVEVVPPRALGPAEAPLRQDLSSGAYPAARKKRGPGRSVTSECPRFSGEPGRRSHDAAVVLGLCALSGQSGNGTAGGETSKSAAGFSGGAVAGSSRLVCGPARCLVPVGAERHQSGNAGEHNLLGLGLGSGEDRRLRQPGLQSRPRVTASRSDT